MTGGGGDSERLFTGASREQGTTRLVVLPVLAFLVLYVILIPGFVVSAVVLGGLLFPFLLLFLFFYCIISYPSVVLSVVLGGLFFLFLLLFLCYLLFLFRSSLSHCSRRFLLPVLTSVSYPYSRLRCVTCCSHSFSV